MSDVLRVFFHSIPSIVFEPVAVLGWMGLITALILYRKERTVLYLTVIFSLAFMIMWRMAIQIVTSRYAEILIFPMTIAAAFFIFQLGNIRKIFPQIKEKYVKYIPILLLFIITAVCIGKNLNYNTYSPVMNAGHVIKADKIGGKRVVYAAERNTQIKYYSQLDVEPLPEFDDDSPQKCIQKVINTPKIKNYQAVYFSIITSSKVSPVTADAIGVNNASWNVVTEQYFNRKKKKILRVYRYMVQHDQKSAVLPER